MVQYYFHYNIGILKIFTYIRLKMYKGSFKVID